MSIPLILGMLFLIGFVADIVGRRLPDIASIVLTIAVASTVILETVGPVFTRLAIRRATIMQADDQGSGSAAGSRP